MDAEHPEVVAALELDEERQGVAAASPAVEEAHSEPVEVHQEVCRHLPALCIHS